MYFETYISKRWNFAIGTYRQKLVFADLIINLTIIGFLSICIFFY